MPSATRHWNVGMYQFTFPKIIYGGNCLALLQVIYHVMKAACSPVDGVNLFHVKRTFDHNHEVTLAETRPLPMPKEFGKVDVNGSMLVATEKEISFNGQTLATPTITGYSFWNL
jgi:hypothetical protein